ncbi:hypothetical protein CC78DRAFT_581536 [Lojkania enalia]|uniref:Uncharacterized protein n=1 Tax=Lojkania enalia TaxID=147567 RepID=A0A9P4K7E3_9PLEO|nr:hypothetical protein CC78DRAFT_581536 [Didymosphaeria enalia]
MDWSPARVVVLAKRREAPAAASHSGSRLHQLALLPPDCWNTSTTFSSSATRDFRFDSPVSVNKDPPPLKALSPSRPSRSGTSCPNSDQRGQSTRLERPRPGLPSLHFADLACREYCRSKPLSCALSSLPSRSYPPHGVRTDAESCVTSRLTCTVHNSFSLTSVRIPPASLSTVPDRPIDSSILPQRDQYACLIERPNRRQRRAKARQAYRHTSDDDDDDDNGNNDNSPS